MVHKRQSIIASTKVALLPVHCIYHVNSISKQTKKSSKNGLLSKHDTSNIGVNFS